ncbi:hypothetical protein CH63R_04866 [Colletotrichum higginsianum IMI 349063]|uniref:Uncharacterized protein n=1 Tax=Colletotrichum higginsianum (strain IMI 349063) TaxID=759273 RepID=A0A1B7YKJ3_COLHI|nr:hypothetical protein CH63R_04866 [Colletotrichum higginsianum IMI 349063]OBR12570.1 hypothetical protein CH63R_04866 [Colletotrichum higginsianum IMI 349063]
MMPEGLIWALEWLTQSTRFGSHSVSAPTRWSGPAVPSTWRSHAARARPLGWTVNKRQSQSTRADRGRQALFRLMWLWFSSSGFRLDLTPAPPSPLFQTTVRERLVRDGNQSHLRVGVLAAIDGISPGIP